MKTLIILASLFLTLSKANADHYSEGYRMGLLTKFSFKGAMWKSWEGQLQLGNNSSIAEGVTPWAFSVTINDATVVEKLQSSMGKFVVLKYQQDLLVATRSTGYSIVDVIPVENKRQPGTCNSASLPMGNFSSGSRIGRLVKISDKGLFNHSWEVIMQVGNSGNEFIQMSVSDDQMAQCLIDYLKTGRRAQVTYDQSLFYNPADHSSSYQILKVEPNQSSLAQ